MFRFNFGALALIAALAAPLAASAQTQPAPLPPAARPAGPGAAAPGGDVQPGTRHHRHRRNGFGRALRSLNLSDAQKQQIAGIMRSARERYQRQPQSAAPADPQTRRANMLALRQQIEGVLTLDQRVQLRANLERGRRETTRGQAPAAPR